MKTFLRILSGIVIGISLSLLGIYLYGRTGQGNSDNPVDLPVGPAAIITHIAGPVFVIRGTETITASVGERLKPGDILKVTHGAVAQVQMAEKGSALLGSDTLVRFMNLTGASEKLAVRTEILTGSMSYNVNQLDEDESIIITTDDIEYSIQGTRFIIVKGQDKTVLALLEGTVQVRGSALTGGVVQVKAKQQLILSTEVEKAVVEDLSAENQNLLNKAHPMPSMPFGQPDSPKPLRLEILTQPPDASIYIDGLKTGNGHLHAILPEGTVLKIRIRRRGFRDESRDVIMDSDKKLQITLEPAGLQETLDDKDPISSNAEYEGQLTEALLREQELLVQVARREQELLAEAAKREEELVTQAAKREDELKTQAAKNEEQLKVQSAVREEQLMADAAKREEELKVQAARQEEALKTQAALREDDILAQLELEKARRKTLEAELTESRGRAGQVSDTKE